ncbi:MAG: caspase family protein, partial [Bryobacteraceae bacterium]
MIRIGSLRSWFSVTQVGHAALFVGVLCVAAAVQAQPPGRKALIIGNSDYRAIGVLRTPLHDAAGLDQALRKLRFETTLVENTTLDRIASVIDKFAKTIRPGDAVFFYYAGYSVQSTDENYLLPVNFDPNMVKDVDYVAYSVSRILSDLEARKPGFLAFLLDGAWDSASLRRRFPETGFARLEPRSQGVFVGFSAGTGRPNYDDRRSPMSLYASAIVEALGMPGLTLSQIAETVKKLVGNASENRQIPTEASTVVQDFYVNPKPPDLLSWEKMKDSQDPTELERFRTSFP